MLNDICDYNCFQCRFADCISDLYLGREAEAHARVAAALAAGDHLRKPRKNSSGSKAKNSYQQRTREWRHSLGLCVDCGVNRTAINPKTGKPKMLCESCTAKATARARLRYQRRKEENEQ